MAQFGHKYFLAVESTFCGRLLPFELRYLSQTPNLGAALNDLFVSGEELQQALVAVVQLPLLRLSLLTRLRSEVDATPLFLANVLSADGLQLLRDWLPV